MKPYWLYVPALYEKDSPLPLVIVLHERGRLRRFSTGTTFDESHLKVYAGNALAAWKDLAEEKGFLLLLPLGDADILCVGSSRSVRARIP